MPRRLAILIGNQTFLPASGLPPLQGPCNDVATMARLLGDPERGKFEVRTLLDRPHHEIVPLIAEELNNRGENELVLIYYSGHGKPDIKTGLCFATADTRESALLATSIPAYHLLNIVDASFHNQVVIILDCCYSALVGGKGDPSAELQQKASETSGLFILTSSDKHQISREEAAEQDGPVLGAFTAALVRSADSDGAANDEGEIRLRRLVDALQRDQQLAGQKPKFFAQNTSGDPLISSIPGFGATLFDPDLLNDLDSPVWRRRLAAAGELGEFLRTGTRPQQNQARRLLAGRLGGERDFKVRQQIEQVLSAPTSSAQPAKPAPAGNEISVAPAPVSVPAQPTSPNDPGRPAWAADYGQDRCGTWASFAVQDQGGKPVSQRLRWCPPGEFLMGSPGNEWGRFDDEGPQQKVRIAHGFWLFDTPCTQALWRAVQGEKVDGSQRADHPVVNVSLTDIDKFLERANAMVPGLNLSLPSEARWEYACRAGTTTATYAGDLSGDQAQQRGILDAIAWWEGNSGGATHEVAGKTPNDWGLHDMLGNVFEWCCDHWHGSLQGAPNDGSAWTDRDGAASRVVRGGSWHGDARGVRAAFRNGRAPAGRDGSFGFRCARVQAG